MSQKANKIQEITVDKFEELLKEQSEYDTQRWIDFGNQ